MTLPATRLATGTAEEPQLSPSFVTAGRAALAGVLSAAFLLLTRSPRPTPAQWRPLSVAVLGNVLLYPLLLGWALRSVTASHAAVVTALMPLATAAAAAWLMHQRAAAGFWWCAVLGSALVIVFSTLRSSAAGVAFGIGWADALLLVAVVASSVGYVQGTRVTPSLGAERVICWMCVAALPLTLPATWWLWPQAPVAPSAWAGFAYVGVFSMWMGFFAWFRGLAIGGALRVSQTQLLQPFFAIGASVLILGETLDSVTLGFAGAVVATVVTGQRLARRG